MSLSEVSFINTLSITICKAKGSWHRVTGCSRKSDEAKALVQLRQDTGFRAPVGSLQCSFKGRAPDSLVLPLVLVRLSNLKAVIDDFSQFAHWADQRFEPGFAPRHLAQVMIFEIVVRGVGANAAKAHL